MSDAWRCFVAVPLDERLSASLADAVGRWRTRPDLAALRWLEPGGWHVTLAFLGSTDPNAVPALVRQLARFARTPASAHALVGVGGFPSAQRARVAWCGIADPERRLRNMAGDVAHACGLPPIEELRPHVTLARAGDGGVDLRRWQADAGSELSGLHLNVDRVQLLRSHLGRGPAQYEPLAEIPLAVPLGV